MDSIRVIDHRNDHLISLYLYHTIPSMYQSRLSQGFSPTLLGRLHFGYYRNALRLFSCHIWILAKLSQSLRLRLKLTFGFQRQLFLTSPELIQFLRFHLFALTLTSFLSSSIHSSSQSIRHPSLRLAKTP